MQGSHNDGGGTAHKLDYLIPNQGVAGSSPAGVAIDFIDYLTTKRQQMN